MEGQSNSTQLRERNLALWNAMQAHPFVTDIKADSLARSVFENYLRYEQLFVETAITIFGHALVKAPELSKKRWLAGVLHALSTEQIAYFETVFQSLGLRPAASDSVLPDRVRAFNDGMLDIAAQGSYYDVIIAMMCAEWMYAQWCEAAAATPISDPNIRAWVMLHTDVAFRQQAAWLRNEVDRIPEREFDFERANMIFEEALSLEIGFHSAAYD
ncbi:MAG: TenA family protein [Janthinobacterium lividum]